MKKSIETEYFLGNKVSDYGIEQGYVDYGTLAKSFNTIFNNNIIYTSYWELINGQEEDNEIFQWYIIDENGVNILTEYTDEFIYYNDELDIYLWGINHCGTAWSYVLTDIKIKKEV